jgi:hypothetical protein
VAPASLAAALEGRIVSLETHMHRAAAAVPSASADTRLEERLASLEAHVTAAQPAARSEAQAPSMADLAGRPERGTASLQGTVPLPSMRMQASAATVAQLRHSGVDVPATGHKQSGDDSPSNAGPAPVMSQRSPTETPPAVVACAAPCTGAGSILCRQGAV